MALCEGVVAVALVAFEAFLECKSGAYSSARVCYCCGHCAWFATTLCVLTRCPVVLSYVRRANSCSVSLLFVTSPSPAALFAFLLDTAQRSNFRRHQPRLRGVRGTWLAIVGQVLLFVSPSGPVSIQTQSLALASSQSWLPLLHHHHHHDIAFV